MRPASLLPAALLALLVIGFPASAQAPKLSRSPRELGTVVLRELEVRGGKLIFRVDSNGCTDASSFKVRASREEGLSPKIPHYRLVVERVRIDECKAMLWDGVLIELDLDKDLGLSGEFTVSVGNPVFPGQGMLPAAPAKADSDPQLTTSLLRSTVKAIELEIDATRARLRVAREGTGPKENVERFARRLDELEVERARFAGMKSEEYPEPVKERSDSVSVLDQPAGFGPILPPVLRGVVVNVDAPLEDGALLSVEGTSKSGPFYHLAGIRGGDYGILKKGKRYRLDLCLVYRREYFGLIGDYYVHVVNAR